VLIESREVSILTDPVVSYEVPSELPRYTHADLPDRIDYVLVTHGHTDHLMLETLLPLRGRIGISTSATTNSIRSYRGV